MVDELSKEEKKLLKADDWAQTRFGYWILVFFGLLGASFSVVAFQCYQWLKVGSWPSITVTTLSDFLGLQQIQVSWIGLQKVINYIYGSPLSVFFFVVAMILIFAITHGEDSDELKNARSKQARLRSSQSN